MKKFIAILLCAMIITLAISGCSQSQQDNKSQQAETNIIKIGCLYPMTGGSANFGELQYSGVQTFVDRVNQRGGVKSLGGAKIELVLADSQSKPDVGVTEFERLVTKEKVCAVLGTYNSGVAAACAPIAIKYKMPFMVTNAIADSILNTDSKYIYRSNPGDIDGQQWILNFFTWLGEFRGKPLEKLSIIYDASDWGKSNYKILSEFIAPKLGAKVVVGEAVQTNSSDLSTTINKVKAANPDIVIPALYLSDTLLFQKQMKEYNCNVPIVAWGGGYLDPKFFDNIGNDADYVISSAHWFSDVLNNKTPEAKDIAAAYKNKYGKDMNETVVNGWLGAAVLIDAIERAGAIDTEKIADSLDVTNLPAEHEALMFHPYQGVKFEDFNGRFNQNKYSAVVFSQIQDKTWKMIFPAEMIKDNPIKFPPPEWSKR